MALLTAYARNLPKLHAQELMSMSVAVQLGTPGTMKASARQRVWKSLERSASQGDEVKVPATEGRLASIGIQVIDVGKPGPGTSDS